MTCVLYGVSLSLQGWDGKHKPSDWGGILGLSDTSRKRFCNYGSYFGRYMIAIQPLDFNRELALSVLEKVCSGVRSALHALPL